MSRVVWTEHRPKLEISNRPASWTDQLDHGRFTNEDGCRHHQRNLKVEAPHFHPQEIDGNVPVQSVPISTPKTLTPQGLLLKRWKTNHFLCPKRPASWKCRRRLPRLRAAAGAHCELTRNSVGERSWWQNKWWKSMERWESMETIHNFHWYGN